jgi:uncharacterized membrane protein
MHESADTGAKLGEATALPWVDFGALTIEILAVVLIVGIILFATASWLYSSLAHRDLIPQYYERYRLLLGRSLLLGLEILVAADIVRTVTSPPTIANLGGLGLLVLVRTFLSWSLVVEVEGRWPWEARRGAPTAGAPPAAAPSQDDVQRHPE